MLEAEKSHCNYDQQKVNFDFPNTNSHHYTSSTSHSSSSLSSSLSNKNDVYNNNNKPHRNVLKAKRRTSELNTSFICVLDTNILLSHLNQIKILILLVNNNNTNKHREHYSNTYDTSSSSNQSTQSQAKFFQTLKIKIKQILIPWIVFQELDGIKCSPNNAQKKAQSAIKFLNEQLKLPNSLIKGEPASEAAIKGEASDNYNLLSIIESNDDQILQCCIRLVRQLKQSTISTNISKNERQLNKVILISNDQNLQNKALVHQIDSLSMEEFMARYLDLPKTKNKDILHINICDENGKSIKKSNDNKCSIIESSKTIKRPRNDLSLSSYLPLSNSSQATLAPNGFTNISNISYDLTKSKQNNKKISSSSHDIAVVDSSLSTPQTTTTLGMYNMPEQIVVVDDTAQHVMKQYQLEAVLTKFITIHLNQTYGEQWNFIFPRFDPNTSNLVECLRLIKNNWIGLFSDAFGRNPFVLQLVKQLLDTNNSNSSINNKQQQNNYTNTGSSSNINNNDINKSRKQLLSLLLENMNNNKCTKGIIQKSR